MFYIVFDLEWNQCPQGKQREETRLPFEIIEIGACKLNEDREIIDTFHVMIKPQVYKEIHFRTQEIIHLNSQNLAEGVPFEEAARNFLQWCGDDYSFCTWGDHDLTEFQRNLKYYHMESMLRGPICYYDVQKLFSLDFEKHKGRRSLEFGIDFLKLPKEEGFHQALADARYTAAIFRRLDPQILSVYYSVDVYQNPKSKEDELLIFYPEYAKFVSREFASKDAAMNDQEVTSVICPYCRQPAQRKIAWFSVNQKNYYSVSVCPEHGLVKGKIRMKPTENRHYYVVKTLKVISTEEADKIQARQEAIRKKRRNKRHVENKQV